MQQMLNPDSIAVDGQGATAGVLCEKTAQQRIQPLERESNLFQFFPPLSDDARRSKL